MYKQLFATLIVLFCLSFSKAFGQEPTIKPLDAGPYTEGSTITALFNISSVGCLKPGNTFSLFLSDANGGFANEVQIGAYSGFYGTFVNGIIPSGTTPGTGYKLRIKTSTPATESQPSTAFEIKAGVAVTAALTSTLIKPTNTEVFGLCTGINNHQFNLINQSDAGSTVTATIVNELSGGNPVNISFANAQSQSFVAQLAHYTVFVKAQMPDGSVATKAYLIINNRVQTAFSTQGDNTVCLPNAVLEFLVNVDGPGGIQNNFPGNTYRISWGDGVDETFTLCDILNSQARISHEYFINSCGRTVISGTETVYNAFGINISAENDFCGRVGTAVSTVAKVINKPKNELSNPGNACLNLPARFVNNSIPGQNPNVNNASCGEDELVYTWYVDGVVVPYAVNKPKTYTLAYTFTTLGEHTIRLESNGSAFCPAEPFELTICVQQPAVPAYKLNGGTNLTLCGEETIKATNTSFTDGGCGISSYNWRINTASVQYLNNTNGSSAEPEFKFTAPGIYTVQLAIETSGCGTILAPESRVVVNAAPTAILSADVNLCGLQSFEFSETANAPTKSTLTGTSEALADTYTWVVSGGAFTFINGTTEHSRYPVIDFTEFKTYTVTVIHKNNCGRASDEQILNFQRAPTVNAGTYTPICFNESVTLNGSVSEPVISTEWIGGAGTFAPNKNTLNAVYTPSLSERQAGAVTLSLKVVTALAAPCNEIVDPVTITIKPQNILTSPPVAAICSGLRLNYNPEASQAGSTFSWTATGSANAAGFSASGSGNIIDDQLINTSPNTNATVTYRITPAFDGCQGDPFELVVTINPKPVITATATTSLICSGVEAGITITSNLNNNKYLWASTVSNPLVTGNSSNSTDAAAVTEINDLLLNRSTVNATVTYTITPVSEHGCAGDPVVVTITVKPLARNTISGVQRLCEGIVPAALVGNDPATGDGPYSYQWQSSIDGGTTWIDISGATGMNYSPPALTVTTDYRRYVSNAICAGSQQNNSNVIKITVIPNAKAEFTATNTQGCIPFMIDGDNIKAIAYPDRNASYSWYVNNTLVGNTIDFPGYTISSNDVSVTIKLVATSSQGCSNSEMSMEFKTVKEFLTSFTVDQAQGCGPLTVNFTNTSSSLTGATFLWDFKNGFTSTDASPAAVTFPADPSGKDKTYAVSLTATNNCGVTAPYIVNILVRGAPVSIFSPDQTTGCSPLLVNFSNTSPEAVSTTYTYDFGDGSPLVVTTDRRPVNNTYTVGAKAVNFTIKMTAKTDCGVAESFHTITVTPNTVIAELVVNSTDKIGCAPFTVPFHNNSGGADHFLYDFGDGTVLNTATILPETQSHVFTRPGIYTVKLTASNDCTYDVTTETITVLGQPEPSFVSDVAVGYPGLEIHFANTTTDAVTYLWNFGDGGTSTSANPSHVYTQLGEYTVSLTVTNLNNCPGTTSQKITIAGQPGFIYVPNAFIPGSTSPEFQLFKAKGYGIDSWRFSIFNKWGELLWETTKLDNEMPAEGWDGTYKSVPVPQGVYYWKIDAQLKNGSAWKGMTYDAASPKRTGTINLIR